MTLLARFFSAPVLLLVASAGLTACHLELAADAGEAEPASTNVCSSGATCGDGVCSEEGICAARETELATVLLEITPSAGTTAIAGVRFTQVVTTDTSLDLLLEHISRVRVKAVGAEIGSDICVPLPADGETAQGPGGSLLARMTLVPRERLLGLPNPSHSAEAEVSDSGEYEVSMSVPPGRYDVYVEPLKSDGACVRPPYLILDQEIAPGDVTMTLQVPPPARLDVAIRFPGMIDELDDWTLDIVDRSTGRLLSNRVQLADPRAVDGALEYRARLAYLPILSASGDSPSELVRLSPPEDATAPQVFFERTVVELFQKGTGVIDQLLGLPDPVIYTGRVNRQDSSNGVEAAVTLVAREIDSTGVGLVTSFSRTVMTDQEGVFEVKLLPGDYMVQVQPLAEELAQVTTDLVVSAGSEIQAGKVLEVSPRSALTGRLLSMTGTPITMTPVEAAPPPRARKLDVIDAARGELPFLPRGQGATTGADGTFALLADAGEFQLVARPEATSSFPWAVRLGVEVAPGGEGELDVFSLSLPYVVEGELSSSDIGSLPSALIRAYAFLRDGVITNQPELATSVVAVGESRVMSDSSFRLLLPATVR